jgi:hypothetical protein
LQTGDSNYQNTINFMIEMKKKTDYKQRYVDLILFLSDNSSTSENTNVDASKILENDEQSIALFQTKDNFGFQNYKEFLDILQKTFEASGASHVWSEEYPYYDRLVEPLFGYCPVPVNDHVLMCKKIHDLFRADIILIEMEQGNVSRQDMSNSGPLVIGILFNQEGYAAFSPRLQTAEGEITTESTYVAREIFT